MLAILFAQQTNFWNFRTWGFTELAIAVVVIAAIAGLVFVALREFKVPIPQWFINCILIVVVAAVVIFCIRMVASL